MIPDHIAALICVAIFVLSLAYMAWEVAQATDVDDEEGWS